MMAQVSIPPSPAAMSRRAPLSNLPNAVNSTYQMSTVTKRSRSQSTAQRDVTYGQPPPKKQAVEAPSVLRTPRRSQNANAKAAPQKKAAPRVRPATGGPPTFADIGQAARKPAIKTAETTEEQYENVRAWQRHYRKAFPAYVFYFENIPSETQLRAQKQILALGATFEKFFSTKVTHLITNRSPPSEEAIQHPTTTALRWNARTVNPSLIDQKTEGRKGTRGTNDVLLKAREWGIKIWATEKLERVLVGLIDVPGRHAANPANQRNSQQPPVTAQTHTNIDLSHVLRNERLHGPTDRDPSVVSKVLHYWKGPYIYVYDMFGIVRPVMLREYPKVQRREEGTWPQFRSVSTGKCPFIDEQVHQRREKQIERPGNVEEKVGGRVEPKAQPQETRRPSTTVEAKMRAKPSARAAEQQTHTKYVDTKAEEDFGGKPIHKDKSPAKLKTYVGKSKRILAELNHTDTRANSQTVATGLTGDSKSTALRAENAIAFTSTHESTQPIRRYNVEPAASGVQPSNITSAIRSQMISSHQDQPGQRAGTSKELYALQRKVAGHVLSSNQLSKPATMARRSVDLLAMRSQNDLRTARKRDAEGKEKAMEVEGRKEMGSNSQRAQMTKKKVEPKPGYCENCREKFDDFDEHTSSRRHRKFATDNKNWAELDALLTKLVRPLKDIEYDGL